MNYFNDDTHFDPRNLDTLQIQEDMDFYNNLYRWYSHQVIMKNDTQAEKRAIMAYTISETLKAILCLCADQSNQSLYNSILDELCPIKHTETVRKYEFACP